MKGLKNKAMLMTSLLSVHGMRYPQDYMDKPVGNNHCPRNKMNLSFSELEKLASLNGKEKKKYIRELKEKYSSDHTIREKND